MIKRIISGGQSGVDQAGLRAAKSYGVPTGGQMPLGFRTEFGPRPEFRELFGMTESDWREYKPRTQHNAKNSDLTIFLRTSKKDTPGFYCTQEAANNYGKPFWDTLEPKFGNNPINLCRFLRLFNYEVINIAGPRESLNPGIGQFAEIFMCEFLILCGFKRVV